MLGMISMKPMSGYEIKQSMEKSLGYFWQESYGQIYPTLKILEIEGLVKSKSKLQSKGVEKIIYSITSLGEKELVGWLKKEVEIPIYRNELLLKLFFGKKISVTENLKHLESQKLKTEKSVSKFEDILKKGNKLYSKNPNQLFWLSTVKYGIEIFKAELKWIESTKKEFESLNSSK